MDTQNNSADNSKTSYDAIRRKALRLLGRREYSQSELQKKLLEKFPEEASFVEEILQEFVDALWISDIRYAKEFVREKSLYGGWGPIKIFQKLRERGIDPEMIQSAMERGFSEELQQKVAQQLAEEKWNRLYKKTAPERKAAVQRFLSSRGFPFSIVLVATETLK